MTVHNDLRSYVAARDSLWSKAAPVSLFCGVLFAILAGIAVAFGKDSMAAVGAVMVCGYASFVISAAFDYLRQKSKNTLPEYATWVNFLLCLAFFLTALYLLG